LEDRNLAVCIVKVWVLPAKCLSHFVVFNE